MAKRWYVLHTYSGYENKIARELQRTRQQEDLTNVLTDVKVPSVQVSTVTRGKQRVIQKLYMPCYILVEMDLPEAGWKNVCSHILRINGVTSFVGSPRNVRPQPISQEEARAILQKTGEIDGEAVLPQAGSTFDVGENVKIIDGPFDSFTGKVEEVNQEKSRLRVTVGIFGRATPVEVTFMQVEKIQ